MAGKKVKVLRVIDGDTIEILAGRGIFRSSKSERVRLYGIDAPETSQRGGKESTNHLKRLIGNGGSIWMERKGVDQYGRTVGLLHRSRRNPQDSINYGMVRDGQARRYMANAQDEERFKEAEAEATRRKKGIWKRKGETAPWEHRREAKRRNSRRGRVRIILLLAAVAAVSAAIAYHRLGWALPTVPIP